MLRQGFFSSAKRSLRAWEGSIVFLAFLAAAAETTASLTERQFISQLFASQAREPGALEALVAAHAAEAKQTSEKIKKLYTAIWLTGLNSFLLMIVIAGFARYIAK